MIRTVLYLRCSSVDQVRKGFSIPDQLARLRSEAKLAGETIVGEYIDQAQSGTSALRRREYQRLLTAGRQKEYDRVRVESVDRGHRNDLERRQFEEELRSLGIQIIYSGEPERQAPQYRKFNRGVRGLVAELESDETSQRTYKRQLYRAKKGKWRGGVIPYGLLPDGEGWFIPDPETYPALCWILERRGEGLGHHSIALLLNKKIVLGDTPAIIPTTPGLRLYLRKPYLERQDPETGDIIQFERRVPSMNWHRNSVREICESAVDGVYAGILQWGHTHNRFDEDAEGRAKEPVVVDTGRPLVDATLLEKVQAVECGVRPSFASVRTHNTFLLAKLLYCGHCGYTLHGHTQTKYSRGRQYKYRKYRCNGRAKHPGSCTLTILGADKLEQIVLEALFAEMSRVAPKALYRLVNDAVERQRNELVQALGALTRQIEEAEHKRNSLLEAVVRDQSLTPLLKQAIMEQAETAVKQVAMLTGQQKTLHAGLATLDAHARTIERILQQADVDSNRWQEPGVRAALRRALQVMVVKIEVLKQKPHRYTVRIWLCEAEKLLFSEFARYESAWGSNPPAQLVTTPTRFEDEGSHRATSALIRHSTRAP